MGLALRIRENVWYLEHKYNLNLQFSSFNLLLGRTYRTSGDIVMKCVTAMKGPEVEKMKMRSLRLLTLLFIKTHTHTQRNAKDHIK